MLLHGTQCHHIPGAPADGFNLEKQFRAGDKVECTTNGFPSHCQSRDFSEHRGPGMMILSSAREDAQIITAACQKYEVWYFLRV